MNAKLPSKLHLTSKQAREFWGNEHRWQLLVDGKQIPAGTSWEAKSLFGSVHAVVVCDEHGNPVFDRPVYREAPNVNMVAWGIDGDGKVRVAVIRQPRPHSDLPGQPGVNDHPAVVFGQIPMGFLEKTAGIDDDNFENLKAGAIREIKEETGATAVLEVERPQTPLLNPAPSFCATWSELFFVKVDLNQIEALKPSHSEPIYSADYITLSELRKRIAEGVDSEGAIYRYGNACALWLIFLCCHPEFITQMAE